MKKIILIITLIINVTAFSQITKMAELSSLKYLDSKTIYEDNGEDVYGYILLFEKNKANKDTHELQFILLDKNMNKVGSNEFTQSQYSTWLVDLKTMIYFAKKYNDSLYISIADLMPTMPDYFDVLGVPGYRIINLKDMKISDQYYLHDYKLEKQVKDKLAAKDYKDSRNITATDNAGFIVFDELALKAAKRLFFGRTNGLDDIKQFRFFDLDFNQKWVYNYNQGDAKSFYEYVYFKGNGKDMVFRKYFYERPSDSNLDISYEVINAETGKKKFEFTLINNQNTLVYDSMKFETDKIIVYASVYDYDDKQEYKVEKKRGYAKIVYDQNTGKELSKDFFIWTDLAPKFDINEFGKIKEYGFIHFLEFNPTKDNKTIVIAEGYKPAGNSSILDLFLFVFDSKMKLISSEKIEKFKNKVGMEGFGNQLERYGAFDYMYSQKLPNDNFIFYYSDNEKADGNRARKNPNWVLGIISYSNGAFKTQKIPLTTKNGQIYPLPAKKGYVLLKEVFGKEKDKDREKDAEYKLEKIDIRN